MLLCINVVSVSLLICYTAPVYSKSVCHGECNECDFEFDACRYPTNDEYAIDQDEFHTITEDEIDYIQGFISAERKARCEFQLRKLDEKKLKDIIKIQSSATENLNAKSNITTTYMKIATLTFLLDYLDSELAKASEECCLSYPTDISNRLRIRILNNWYIYQSESIDHSQCNVCVNVDVNGPAGCERTRDSIYILLKHVRVVLKNSNVVLKSITP